MKKEIATTKAINYIVNTINSTNISFAKKRYCMIQKIEEYYISGEIRTEEIIERKLDMKHTKDIFKEYFIPLVISMIGALFLDIMLHYFSNVRSTAPVFIWIYDTLGQFGFAFIVVGLFFVVKKLKKDYTSFYDKFDLEKEELRIIDSILDRQMEEESRNE